ncbi:MAG: sulfatase [Candidatus Brocadiia bacterium]
MDAERPNIVWIWADNLAYRDLGCYGSPSIRTPRIDRLAEQGVRLTQYYIAHVVCSPSRAGLLTGRQPFRVGITDVLRPDSPTGIPDEEITLGEALGRLGYATMAIGKWHLGDRPQHLPTRHGFDGYFGLPYSMDMLPTILIRDEEIIEELPGREVADITERYTREAIGFVTANKDRPFFLYLSHTIPHPPLNLPERCRTPGRSIYEDAIEHLDEQMGVLLDALDRLGLAERTLVVFSSDNGPMSNGGDTGGLRGRIRSSYEGGVRVPFVARFPGRLPEGRTVDVPMIAYDVFPTLVHLAGGEVPEDREYDGQDVWPVLTGKGSLTRRKPFVWVYDDNVTAIREGRWKLHLGRRNRPLKTPELYDVEADPGESRDLADQHPDVAQRLRRKALEFQKQVPTVWQVKYPVRDPRKADGGIRRK